MNHAKKKSVKSITVRDRAGKIIRDPILSAPVYARPGYRILCPGVGFAIIIEGKGVYDGLGIASAAADASINIDFCEMGIGGLKEQLTALIRQALISRLITPQMREDYAVKDAKGILLYGPPGTGKTLIARNIGRIIPGSVIVKINGPELASKFVGETEANIRKIFDGAKKSDKLHVFIFDEIDAVGRKRGGDGGVHDDKALTQLLTMIDGLDSATNVLVIGITNRYDVLDPALVRSGRLEFHVEIPLPTAQGRQEIAEIYLRPLRSRGLLSGIDSTFAANLEGYSGADLEAVIGRAKNLALLRNCDITDNLVRPVEGVSSAVTAEDIREVLGTFKPTFTQDDLVGMYLAKYPLPKDTSFGDDLDLPDYSSTPIQRKVDSIIAACHMTVVIGIPFVKYVGYNDFLGLSTAAMCAKLESAYRECLQANRAVMIFDSLGDVGDRALLLKKRHVLETPINNYLIILEV